jgi:hypothetical protein
VLPPDVVVVSLADAAKRLEAPESKVRQLLRDGHLIAIRRDKELLVPEQFLTDSGLVKGLAGTLTVLSDAGFEPTEMLNWLFTADESLPGTTPINALRTNHGAEVKRRAQALAF